MYYKFRSCEQRTWEILINQELYYARPVTLNDPLDASFKPLSEYENLKQEILSGETEELAKIRSMFDSVQSSELSSSAESVDGLFQRIFEVTQQMGILSLSKTATDALLWSHYGNGHKGVCLGFDSEIAHESYVNMRGDVIYNSKPAYNDAFLSLAEKFHAEYCPAGRKVLSSTERIDFIKSMASLIMKVGMFGKSEKWKYEEEYRLASLKPGHQTFPSRMLQEVILGLKTSEEDQRTVRNLLKDSRYKHVALKRVVHVPGTYHFEIKRI
jgi:hypothetical protein